MSKMLDNTLAVCAHLRFAFHSFGTRARKPAIFVSLQTQAITESAAGQRIVCHTSRDVASAALCAWAGKQTLFVKRHEARQFSSDPTGFRHGMQRTCRWRASAASVRSVIDAMKLCKLA